MELIDIEKLADYKILPFDLFDADGNAIFFAGEVLTPGKIMQLKELKTIYRLPPKKSKENFEGKDNQGKENYDAPQKTTEKFIEKTEEKPEKKAEEKIEKKTEEERPAIQENIVENVDIVPSAKYVSPIDGVDENKYIGPINITSTIDTKTQIKLKSFYYQVNENIQKNDINATVNNIIVIRDKILNDLTKTINKTNLFSELKLVGEYSKCHDLNVAILANAFAIKYGLKAKDTQDLVLSALLHDIGKKYISQDLLNKPVLSASEKHELESHTIVGYKVIKEKMRMPERIALPALQHHEYINGTGYPNKLSEENMDLFSQIVGICSHFDNLTFNRTDYKVNNVREALRYIMEKWKELYSSDVLYTFIYMFSYNDIKNFDDMVM